MFNIPFTFVLFQKHNCTVNRRYNDFVAFHDLLLLRFPYRLIPTLPPKKLMGGKLKINLFTNKNVVFEREITLICIIFKTNIIDMRKILLDSCNLTTDVKGCYSQTQSLEPPCT